MSEIKDILSKYKNIAMIGVSNDPTKASTIVMKYMQKYGFKVYPVNPKAKGQKILGEEVFGKITDIKDPVDIVDVFRPSKEIPAIAAYLKPICIIWSAKSTVSFWPQNL